LSLKGKFDMVAVYYVVALLMYQNWL